MTRWTARRIAEYMTPLLQDTRLILVSNREPYSHRWHRHKTPQSSPEASVSESTIGRNLAWVRQLSSHVTRLLQGNNTTRCSQPAGGLTSALDPIMQACHGTWVAWGSGSADRQVVDAHDRVQVPPQNPQYTLRRV
jgi:trehalose 6-phosphate synthase